MANNNDIIPAVLGLDAFQFDTLHKVEVGDHKVKLPFLDMDNLEEEPEVYLLNWCDYVYSKLSVTEADDTSDYFTCVRSLLTGGTLDHWQDIFQAIPANADLDLARLRDCMKELVAFYVEEDDRTRQLDYLRDSSQSHKPPTMTVATYKERLDKVHRLATTWMPGATVLGADEMKLIFHHGMPRAWQNEYVKLKGSASKAANTLADMVTQYKNLEAVSLRQTLLARRQQCRD